MRVGLVPSTKKAPKLTRSSSGTEYISQQRRFYLNSRQGWPHMIINLNMTGLLLVTLIILTLCLELPLAWAADRAELGHVLNIMPPNGPAAKYGTLVMRRLSKKAGMPPVVFPHWSHRARYTCNVCHSELEFAMRAGGSGITRQKYLAGKFCGRCHDGKTAFTVKDGEGKQCDRCHMKDTTPITERFEAFAATLPTAPFGNGIDWAAALAQNRIAPLSTLSPDTKQFKLPGALKKPLALGTTSPRSAVSFSHEEHLAQLDCANCHPDIFNINKRGTQLFSMEVNLYGQFCGACHMKVAFPMNDCRRCHPEMSNISF